VIDNVSISLLILLFNLFSTPSCTITIIVVHVFVFVSNAKGISKILYLWRKWAKYYTTGYTA